MPYVYYLCRNASEPTNKRVVYSTIPSRKRPQMLATLAEAERPKPPPPPRALANPSSPRPEELRELALSHLHLTAREPEPRGPLPVSVFQRFMLVLSRSVLGCLRQLWVVPPWFLYRELV